MRLKLFPRTELPLLRMLVFAPLDRVTDAPIHAKAMAVIAATAGWFVGTPFRSLVCLYALIMLFDYFTGAALAHKEGRYDENIARLKAVGKISGVFYVLVIRALENVIEPYFNTKGIVAFALLVLLVVYELESWDRNREALTGTRLPFVRQVLGLFKGVAVGRLNTVAKDEPR